MQTHTRRFSFARAFAGRCLAAVALLFFSAAAFAQVANSFNGPMTPGGLLDTVFDRFGNNYALREIAINDGLRASTGNAKKNTLANCSPGYFRLYLEEGCGMDSFATNPMHQQRLNVLCQVLTDLSNFISSPLTDPGDTQKVNLWVRDISVFGAPSNALGLATSFYNIPYADSGIADNTTWLTILSGKDAYTNVAPPLYTAGGAGASGSVFFHGIVAIGTDVNWDLTLNSPPAGDEYDLYTVLLHEITHALGFASLIDINGNSRLNIPGTAYYSRYDRFLRKNNTPLITNSGSCSLYGYHWNNALNAATTINPASPTCTAPTGSSSDNTVCGTAVKYVGSNGDSQAVYTPGCYETGSTFSHFEDQCQVPSWFPISTPASNNKFFVMSESQLAGVMKRHLREDERRVLCDLGYSVKDSFGVGSFWSDTMYSGGVCEGLQVAGINDGMTGGIFNYVSTGGGSVIISDVLANDYGADALECVEVLIGQGAISLGSGSSFTYTPMGSLGQIHLLRYIPINTATNKRGNVTYVFISTISGNCVPTPCDLVNNGGFEIASSLGSFIVTDTMNFPEPPATVACWSSHLLTPDLFTDTMCVISLSNQVFQIPTTFSIPPSPTYNLGLNNNRHFLGMGASSYGYLSGGYSLQEGIGGSLNTPLIPGETYKISYWSKIAHTGTGPQSEPNMLYSILALGSTAPLSYGTYAYLPNWALPPPAAVWLDSGSYVVVNNQWQYISDTFTFNGLVPANYLTLIPAGWMNTHIDSFWGAYHYIDDVSIVPLYLSSMFNLPDSVCYGTNIDNLESYVQISGGSFSGPGVDSSSAGYTLNTISAGVDTQIISYTYTTPDGCIRTEYENIRVVVNASVNLTANTNVLCPGDTIHFVASGASTYLWSPAITCTGNCSTGYAIVNAPTIFTVTGTLGTGCADTAIASVVFNPSVSPPPAVPIDTIIKCIGDPITALSATGTNLLWYTSELGGTGSATPSMPSTASAGTTTYWVSQLAAGYACRSVRIPVSIIVNPVPVVPTVSPLSYCQGQTGIPALTATGDTLRWYYATPPPAGTPLPGAPTPFTGAPGTFNYYVVQTANGCASAYATLPVTVFPPYTIQATAANPSLCLGGSTAMSATGLPAGAAYFWSPAIACAAPCSSGSYTPAAAGATSFTVTASPSLACVTMDTIVVTTTDCSACTNCTDLPVSALGFLTADPAPGDTFCINQSITISGNRALKGSVFKIREGVTITVPSGAVLSILGSHLYGCQKMWRGIVVEPGGRIVTGAYQLPNDFSQSSLMEDADTAIAVRASGLPANGPAIVSVRHTTFNRCDVGVLIADFSTQSISDPWNKHYPFVVENCLFTSRNCDSNTNAFALFAHVDDIKAADNPVSDPLQSPYIDTTRYPSLNMKAPRNTLKPFSGVMLVRVGKTTVTSSPFYGAAVNPSGLKIGGGSTNGEDYNVFDNLHTGIRAEDANAYVTNNVFQNSVRRLTLIPTPYPHYAWQIGTGVMAVCNTTFNGALRLDRPVGSDTRNWFYNCHQGVYTSNYLHQQVRFASFRSTHDLSPASVSGQMGRWGVRAYSNRFRTCAVLDDSLFNLTRPVEFIAAVGAVSMGSAWMPSSGSAHFSGALEVGYNYIAPALPGQGIGSRFTDVAISCDGLLPATASLYLMYGSWNPMLQRNVWVHDNLVKEVYRGVHLSNWFNGQNSASKDVVCQNNCITLRKPLGGTPFATGQQYGIAWSANNGTKADLSLIGNNKVHGYNLSDTGVSAIRMSLSNSYRMMCNATDSSYYGHVFSGKHTGLTVYNNELRDHQRGYTLLGTTATTDTQGTSKKPLDNRWVGNWSGRFKTASMGGANSAVESAIWVRDSSIFDPDGSCYFNWQTPFGESAGSILIANPVNAGPPVCGLPSCVTISVPGTGGTGTGAAGASTTTITTSKVAKMEGIAQCSYPIDDPDSTDICRANQLRLYRFLMSEPEWLDSSAILYAFAEQMHYAEGGDYEEIDEHILAGDATTAQDLIDELFPDGEMSRMQRDFYRIYLAMQQEALSEEDSAKLYGIAASCPLRFGGLIYQARTLYQMLYSPDGVIENDCESLNDEIAVQYRQIRTAEAENERSSREALKVAVYPNPTTGDLHIALPPGNKDPWQAEIRDVRGGVISTASGMSGAILSMQIKAPPGIYLLRLTNERTQQRVTRKVVVNQ